MPDNLGPIKERARMYLRPSEEVVEEQAQTILLLVEKIERSKERESVKDSLIHAYESSIEIGSEEANEYFKSVGIDTDDWGNPIFPEEDGA